VTTDEVVELLPEVTDRIRRFRAAGLTAAATAKALNADDVPGPAGGWTKAFVELVTKPRSDRARMPVIRTIESVDETGKVIRRRYRFVVDLNRPDLDRRRDQTSGKPRPKRDQRTYTFDSFAEARRELSRIIAERDAGTLVKPDRRRLLRAQAEDFLLRKAGKKPSTRRSYEDALRPVLELFGDMALQKFEAKHLEIVKARMLSGELRRIGTPGKPLSARSVNYMLTVTSMMLEDARKRKRVSTNEAEFVERVPSDPDAGADRSAWQTSDAVAFLRHVRADRLYAAWLLSLLGMRRGEVLGIRRIDLDLDGVQAALFRFPEGTPTLEVVENRVLVEGKIFVGTPKSRAGGRRLPVPAPMVAALREHLRRQAAERLAAGLAYDNPEGLLFVDEVGQPLDPERYSDWWLAHGKAAGLPRLTLHGARHVAASLLAEWRVPDVVRMAWVGHATLATTQGYTHAQAEQMVEASRILGEVLASG
jgi:integrase